MGGLDSKKHADVFIVQTMFPSSPDTANTPVAELAEIMRWYVEMGVDIAVDGEPHDRFADSAAEIAKREAARAAVIVAPPAVAALRTKPATLTRAADAPAARQATAPAAALSQDAAAQMAREQAQAASTLEELREALEAFDGCTLKRSASRLVFADGNPKARIMLIGEAPADDEDRQGVPFVGRDGRLLDTMLAAIGLDRTQVYIANVVPWRPPGNRIPTPLETAICLPFIRRQIALVNPDLIVCLGAASAQALLGVKDGILRARGRWFDFTIEREQGDRVVKALPTLHPAYLMRSPRYKREAWQDLRLLKKAIEAAV